MKFLLMIGLVLGLQPLSAKTVKQVNNIRLTSHNNCVLDTQVDANSMSELKKCLVEKVSKRGSKNYPIYLYINSPGGSVYHGLRFIEFAKSIRNLNTITSFAASMGAAIAQGIPGKRYVTDGSVMMFHRARGSVSGQFENGELENRLRLWKKIVRNMEQMQADRIGITLKDYKKKRMNEWWLYGDENIRQKTADSLITVSCTTKLMKETSTVKVRTIFGAFEKEKSACPMVN